MTDVEVHLLAFNEEEILPFTLRHYLTVAARIVVHDARSTDGTRDIAARYGAEVRDWNTGGLLDDESARTLKNTAWRGTQADWVIVADADELIYFPQGVEETLRAYAACGVAVAKPQGWEMFSETFPTGAGQIYDEVKTAAREDRWYSKPILFAPARLEDIAFTAGAHTCRFCQAGRWHEMPRKLTQPECWLLHCSHLGPIERIAAKLDAKRARLSPLNVKRGWGNFDPGMQHAQEKRALIMSGLVTLFP